MDDNAEAGAKRQRGGRARGRICSLWRAARSSPTARGLRAVRVRLGGGLAWLTRRRAPILWAATFGLFLLTNPWLDAGSQLPVVLIPVVALLLALPLGIAANHPLGAWLLLVVMAVVVPLAVPPAAADGGPPQFARSPYYLPWHPTMLLTGAYVLYTAGARLPLRLLLPVWLATEAVVFWAFLTPGRRDIGETNGVVLIVMVLVVFGYLVGPHRRMQRALAEEERRRRQEEARRALLEERTRIARELHDVVAHHMSVIAVRSETAPFRFADMPGDIADDIAQTSVIAREALVELRRLLGVLRGADTRTEPATQPGMDRLDGLVASIRSTGLAVDMEVAGAAQPLPSSMDLAVYRIVQEALSNVLRHAPGAQVDVVIAYEPERLRLRVHNNAPPVRGRRPPSTPGHGLVGMRERATVHGGELTAEPTPAGGFLVEAILPLHDHQGTTPDKGTSPASQQPAG